jgi:acetyl-CoA C-acetyltransferase
MTIRRAPAPTGASPIVITHALRTPIGKYLGTLADQTAADLGQAVVRALLAQAQLDPAQVGELIFGCGRQAGSGPNVARQISVRAGIPQSANAWTANLACGSGLKSILLAADSIRNGTADIVVAGGTESMSGLPFYLPRYRTGYRLGSFEVVDAMYKDGFDCPLAGMRMGETAEKLAQDLGISRAEQDRFALASQHKAAAAQAAGRFASELAPIELVTKKGSVAFATDEHARADTTMESLAKLPPVFDPKRGTVTAGNSSGITDGAAALLMMSEAKAQALGLEPLAWLGMSAQAGVDPKIMGIGPVPAFAKLKSQNGLAIQDYDLVELNEAFAAQVIACDRELAIDPERLNVNGGSIALGHPIGCTGARIVVTLLAELKRRNASNGLATLCISGGQGLAVAFHRSRP